MTVTELQNNIDTYSALISDFGKTSFDSRPIWSLKNEIFENFKETDFTDRNERQELWNIFQQHSTELKERQNAVNKENEQFAEDAEKRIGKIHDLLDEGVFRKEYKKEEFAEIKDLIGGTFEFIKQSRWPNKERREKAWAMFNQCRDDLRRKEDEHYSKLREKINKRNEHSEELTEKILQTIDACDPDSDIDDLIRISAKFLAFLTPIGYIATGFDFLFKAFEIGIGLEKEKPKSPLKLKSDAIREVRKFIADNKDDITREDKQKIYATLDEINEKLDVAWTEHKEEIERRKEERQQKQKAWEQNQREFLSKLEARLDSQISFKEKLEKRLENQEEFLIKMEKVLENQEEFLEKLKGQLEKLEDDYSEAWSDSFRDRVSEWIDSKKDKIKEVEDDIESIELKIADVKTNIRELLDKIREVENSIDEIERKIDEVKGKL